MVNDWSVKVAPQKLERKESEKIYNASQRMHEDRPNLCKTQHCQSAKLFWKDYDYD